MDWYPWGDEAFEKAAREQKPVFVSIGYSTCHWCHVMEHESFANEQVARLMNEAFVSIKVDREERPDLDDHFMNVSQLLTGGGGWPLTIIMTPDKRPFFAGTYIPREPAYGRMGMLELIPRVQELYQRQRDEVEKTAQSIAEALTEAGAGDGTRAGAAGAGGGTYVPAAGLADRVTQSLASRFDAEHGGFGGAPRFPMPSVFPLLLAAWKRTGNAEALSMVERTLSAMRSGGIYDQVGFGFHRYSTDDRWLVPHFEKMLYDQAQLAMAYTDAWLATAKPEYRETARETLSYMLRDLLLPEGGFASAEDADSEGEEGKFYLWTAAEIQDALGAGADDFTTRYRVMSVGNYIDPVGGHPPGGPSGGRGRKNILHRDPSDVGPPGQAEESLRLVREKRVRPSRDDKVLVDWNGLAIAALARAGRALAAPPFVQAAERAARFLLGRLRLPSGGLLHRYRDGDAAIPGFADDYAFLAWGLFELYQATYEPVWLRECLQVVGHFRAHFWDDTEGGFFQTGPDAEKGIARRKSFTDGVIPSANSVAALVLLKLNQLTGEIGFRTRAEAVLRLYPPDSPDTALSWAAGLCAEDFAVGPAAEVVIVGDPGASDTREMLGMLHAAYLPRTVVILKPAGRGAEIESIASFTGPLRMLEGKATAWVCRDFTCSLPTRDPAVMMKQLEGP